jgi:hypothetical protein
MTNPEVRASNGLWQMISSGAGFLRADTTTLDQKLHSLAFDTKKSRNTVTRFVSFNSSG